MNVYHEPSDTWYCDEDYRVLDGQRRCPRCDSTLEAVLQSPFVDFHAAERFRERVSPSATWRECIESVRRIVLQGAQLPALQAAELVKGRPDCQYFIHHAFPTAVAVLRPETNAVITVLLKDPSATAKTS